MKESESGHVALANPHPTSTPAQKRGLSENWLVGIGLAATSIIAGWWVALACVCLIAEIIALVAAAQWLVPRGISLYGKVLRRFCPASS